MRFPQESEKENVIKSPPQPLLGCHATLSPKKRLLPSANHRFRLIFKNVFVPNNNNNNNNNKNDNDNDNGNGNDNDNDNDNNRLPCPKKGVDSVLVYQFTRE